MNKLVLATSVLLLSSSASFADHAHTQQTVFAQNEHWVGHLDITSGNELGFFTNGNEVNLGEHYQFNLNSNTPFKYGFGFKEPGTDFNIAYTLTLYKTVANSDGNLNTTFTAPACVFEITASSPANPDITVMHYNGASCHWTSTGIGENFTVG